MVQLNSKEYAEIKRRIKHNINVPYSYPAEDLIQDVIIKLIKNKKNTQSDCIRQSVRVAKHLVIDHYRKSRKFKCVYDQEPENECYQMCDLSFTIPEQYKELYVLRYKMKMKYEEISQYLNTPIGTIKNRIWRMKKEIKLVNGL